MTAIPSMTEAAILRGKYRLLASIGRGGMGEVFEAVELATGHTVAIKVVSRTFADDLLMARLHREAEAARRIKSDYVPYLFEVDHTADGELFLVMERLHGETLAERLKRRPGTAAMSWDDVRRMGEDVLHGLIDAHGAGVIHRDLKPGNIFIERDGRTKILDFGVCKLDAHDGESLTSTGEAVGTISYMAPEQIRGASKVDERADIYSFAMVVFEALSGRLAHDASGQIAMIASKLERAARNLREVQRVPVPPGLDQLLARCLSRKPIDRPASVADLLRAWKALGPATVTPHLAPLTPMRAIQLSQTAETDLGLTAGASSKAERRGTRLGLIVASCGLVVASVVLVVGLRLNAATPEPPATPRAAANVTEPALDTRAAVAPTAPPSLPAPMPIVTVSATPLSPESLPIEAAPVEPTKPAPRKAAQRVPPKSTAAPTPRPASGGPQISVEPRY